MGEHDLIRRLERRFLPTLRAAEAEINASFPGARAQVWSQPHGWATDSPGHVIGLSCHFPDAPLDQPDEVTLELCFGGVLSPNPTVDSDVVWGHPGQVEAVLFPEPVALSEGTLQQVEAGLPHLIAVLGAAVRRGRPLG